MLVKCRCLRFCIRLRFTKNLNYKKHTVLRKGVLFGKMVCLNFLQLTIKLIPFFNGFCNSFRAS